MRRADVQVGGVYLARVSGRIVDVRVGRERPTVTVSGIYDGTARGATRARHGGWDAVNLATGRTIVVTAGRLRPHPTRGPLGPMPCGYVREGTDRAARHAHYAACAHTACKRVCEKLSIFSPSVTS